MSANRLTQPQFFKVGQWLLALPEVDRKIGQEELAKRASAACGFAVSHGSLVRAAQAAGLTLGNPHLIEGHNKSDRLVKLEARVARLEKELGLGGGE